MNFRTLLTASAALSIAAAAPLPALALDDMQKKEMGDFIREYILENPEILLEAQEALQHKQQQEQLAKAGKSIADNQKAIFASDHDIALGNPDGYVTVVEFFDYNCGYCKRALSAMQEFLEKDENARSVLKEPPIDRADSLAVHTAPHGVRDIAPEKYGAFHRALLRSEGRASEESSIAVAAGLGLDEAEIRKTMQEKPHDDAVREA